MFDMGLNSTFLSPEKKSYVNGKHVMAEYVATFGEFPIAPHISRLLNLSAFRDTAPHL